MKSTWVISILTVILLAGAVTAAQDRSPRTDLKLADGGVAQVLHGAVIAPAKAKADTVYLLGGPDRGDGDFQDDVWPSFPRDEGFTSIDMTEKTEAIWHVSTYNASLLDPGTVPNHAMWCGEDFPVCAPGDPFGGYGNNYNEYLDWYGVVPNSLGNTAVRLTATLNYENEEGFDYLYLEVERQSGMEIVGTWNGSNRDPGTGDFVPVNVDINFTATPQDYVGTGGDQVHLRWRFTSDGAWSDEDCLNPTAGGAQIDLITVYFNGTPWAIDGFEPGNWVNWNVAFPPAVGDFAWTWPALQDIDPCHTNWTPQFAFIDDGLVLPGTGGYTCTTWCYGPDGYIVNPEGGLAGPDFYIHDEIWSPQIQWPGSAYDGAMLAFGVYRHETLAATAPGVFYVWHVRSSDDPTGVDNWSAWQDRGFVYYGGPDYFRDHEVVTDLLVPDRQYIQIALGVEELGYVWGFVGTDGYPAPYFDNVAVTAFTFGGPAISTRDIDQAQDNFPEIGDLDLLHPGANSIRFDMVQNIAPQDDLWNDPGDSITFDVVAVRAASVLNDMPKLHYKMDANPIFDPYRTSGLPTEGWVYGDSTRAAGGFVVADRYCFDLPDTGFFFPGDVIHYYVSAEDNQGGDVKTSILPGDTTGFSLFAGDAGYSSLLYPRTFTIYGLPSIHDFGTGDQPRMLLWNDFGSRGGEDEWQYALMNLGYLPTIDYDLYTTRGPSSGVGDGLGGRATDLQLMGYETMLYTVGDLSTFTISNGDPVNDAGNDVGLLDAWLRQGGKNLLLTGDDLVFDLQQSGIATQAFISNWISVNFLGQDVRPLIGNQASPLVKPIPGNPVFSVPEWVANGGCPGINYFDAVEPVGNAVRLAEFTSPDGATGVYPYSAATLNHETTYDDNIIHLPYDFMYILEPRGAAVKAPAGSALRASVLEDILYSFGMIGSSPTTDTPTNGVLTVRNYPNPFNPSTRIEFDMPRRGDLSIRVYNVRGGLVATLVDGTVEAGPGHVTWTGRDDGGNAVASGLYFYEVRALGQSRIQKMTLLK